MNDLKIFNNEEFGDIRTVMLDGEPWFVGKDVADALGYEKGRNAIKKHVDAEDALKWGILTNGGRQEMTIINESGLYALIFGSELESANKFKHWVTAEVLPSIRKTGAYAQQKAPYKTKSTSLGEVASFNKEMDDRMEKQGSEPWEICEAFKMVSEQFGVRLPDNFVKKPEYEQMKLPIYEDNEEDK